MLSVRIIRSQELPNQEGLVCHINQFGETVGVTATRCASKRCEPGKMARAIKHSAAGNLSYFRNPQTDGGKGMSESNATLMMKYSPSSWEQFTFTPMPFAQADYWCKQIKKLLLQKAKDENLVA